MNKALLDNIHLAAAIIETYGVKGLSQAAEYVGNREAQAILVANLRLTVAPRGTLKRLRLEENQVLLVNMVNELLPPD